MAGLCHDATLASESARQHGLSLASELRDEATPRPRVSTDRDRLPRLVMGQATPAFCNIRKAVRLEEPITPRASAGASCESPRSTVSTCESDDEERAVLTPLDEASMISSRRITNASSSSALRTSALKSLEESSRDQSGGETVPPHRLDLNLNLAGLSSLESASPIAAYLDGSYRAGSSSLQKMERRGSIRESDKADGQRGSQPFLHPRSGDVQAHPVLSRSTLKDIGSVKGLTPPYLPATATGPSILSPTTSSAESSSVVTAGLEMGLGVNMATAALAAHLPPHTSGLGNLAEPRHHRRPSLVSEIRELTAAAGVRQPVVADQSRVTEAPKANADVSQVRPSSRSDLAADETSLSKMSLNDGDLLRRKTTGWDAGKARREIAKRHRAETPDESVSQLAMRNNSVHHSRDIPAVISLLPVTTGSSDISRGGASSTRSSFDSRDTQARASRTGSTHIDTPSLSGRAMLSPDVNPLVDIRGGILAEDDPNESEHVKRARAALARDAANGGQASFGNNGGLMGSNVGGHFGPGVRAKVIEVLEPLISSVPMKGEDGEVIHLAEYGCLNSRSIPLMQLVISKFARRGAAASSDVHLADTQLGNSYSARGLGTVSEGVGMTHDAEDRSATDQQAMMTARLRGSRHVESQSSKINFTVIHEDAPTSDFRPIIQSLDTRSDSYLDPQWQATHQPSLQNSVFSSFVGRPFASRVSPPNTMHFGLSLMDLHWTHTPLNNAVPLSTCSHAELSTFLKARAQEFKTGGVLMIAFLARSEDGAVAQVKRRKSTSSQATIANQPARQTSRERSGSSLGLALSGEADGNGSLPRKSHTDIWTKLTNTLAPCIQRLVSCGMLKSDVARHLLHLPLHPRTPTQSFSALSSLRHLWKVEWSCGLGEEGSDESASETGHHSGDSPTSRLPPSEASPLRIAHPAWKAFQAGTLSKVALTEHMLMLYKNLYETHFRTVLRERGKLSKGAVEFVLDSLWDILSSKIDDQHPNNPFEEVEIEVTMCALRRL